MQHLTSLLALAQKWLVKNIWVMQWDFSLTNLTY